MNTIMLEPVLIKIFFSIYPNGIVKSTSKIILHRSLNGIEKLMALVKVAKCSDVTKTTPTDIEIATPIIPNVGFEAKTNSNTSLQTAPIMLFHIAGLAKSNACKVACKGDCI